MFNHLEEDSMHTPLVQRTSSPWLLQAATVLVASSLLANVARAQSDLSVGLSMLPVASVVGAAPAVLGAAGAGAVFTVKAVALSAHGTVYVLERASDGAHVSVEVAGRAAGAASHHAGTLVAVSVIGAGVVLSAAGEAIAFLPNALGRALLHNERLTY